MKIFSGAVFEVVEKLHKQFYSHLAISIENSPFYLISTGKLAVTYNTKYRKITSSNTSHLKAHVGFFRLLMKGIFGPFDKKLAF